MGWMKKKSKNIKQGKANTILNKKVVNINELPFIVRKRDIEGQEKFIKIVEFPAILIGEGTR